MYRRSARFNRGPKTAEDKAKNFAIFNPHSSARVPLASKDGTWIQVGSIDPGIYNFAIRIERWHDDGSIETINFSHINFTLNNGNPIPELGKENFYYINCNNTLMQLSEDYLQECQYICIESQLPVAYDMVRLSSHIISALCIYLKDKGNNPLILELDPKLKSRLLGAPSRMKKAQLKQWTTDKACEYFIEEGDLDSLEFMRRMIREVKGVDVGDVKCQLKVIKLLLESGVLPEIYARRQLKLKKVRLLLKTTL
jgi:hypothetical protein